jgi:carboxylesterase type B
MPEVWRHECRMKVLIVFSALQALARCTPIAEDCHESGVVYHGIYANEVEGFVGIRFAHDTSGRNRFKPPRPYVPVPSSNICANETGAACPQEVTKPGSGGLSLSLSVITDISEDCLRLNVWRPNGTKAGDKLPVLAYIYGGGFTGGSKDDTIQQPGGLILQSIDSGYPVMAVEMNYRLGGAKSVGIERTLLIEYL